MNKSKRWMVIAALTAANWFLPHASLRAFQQNSRGSIQGLILREGTSDPVEGARVVLCAAGKACPTLGGGGPAEGNIRLYDPILTGLDGRFSFKDLDPGSYNITVTAEHYLRQAPRGPSTIIVLTAGRVLPDLVIHLVPSGGIVGTITTESGQPANGAPVLALISTIDQYGRKTYGKQTQANADADGNYRLEGLPPGKYIVAAGNGPGFGNSPRPQTGSMTKYEPVYYPNAPDVEQAVPIELNAGLTPTANFSLRVQQEHRIRGYLIDSTTGRAPTSAEMALSYSTYEGWHRGSNGSKYDLSTGTFEMIAPAGVWRVEAQTSQPAGWITPTENTVAGREAARMARLLAAAKIVKGSAAVRVFDRDVDNVEIRMLPGLSVDGRIIVDRQAGVAIPDLTHIELRFSQFFEGVVGQTANDDPVASQPDADGKFRIENVRDGTYVLAAGDRLPPGFYVTSIRYGGKEVLHEAIEFQGAPADPVEVTIRTGLAQLSGVIRDFQGKPVAGALAVLIPLQEGIRMSRYNSARSNENGVYTIARIVPGDYRVFSSNGVEEGAWYDPDFVNRHLAQGVVMHIGEGSSAVADPRLAVGGQ